MNIYPAIDLKNGQCVRLYQGDYEQMTVYENDPLKVAQTFFAQGATTLHIVDLDGAKDGRFVNLDHILQINQLNGLNIQTGGGIRTQQQIRDLLDCGIARVVLGSIAILQPQTVIEWLQIFGAERIVLALDIRMDENNIPMLACHGWRTNSEKSLWDLLDIYHNTGLKHVLCTDIGCDGTLQGPNVVLYQHFLNRYPHIALQASGGIRDVNDLQQLCNMSLAGAVVGKAIYENNTLLRDILREIPAC